MVATATEPSRMGDLGPNTYLTTFWYSLASAPRNIVETMVKNDLFPRVPDGVRERVQGVEWWLGRLMPPYAENFGFGFHRDFGEHPETLELVNPILSSVLYLSTVDDAPLVVSSEDPFVPSEAPIFEDHFPKANTFVMFPGHLWHAVLSHAAAKQSARPPKRDTLRLSVTVNWWGYRPTSNASPPMKVVAADYDGSVYPELQLGGPIDV